MHIPGGRPDAGRIIGRGMVTQAGKLGLKPGLRLDIVNRPAGWALTDPPTNLAEADGEVDSGIADVLIALRCRSAWST